MVVREAEEREFDGRVRAGGFGELLVSIKFHKGQPQELHVLERKPHYRLGGGLPGDNASTR